MLPFYLRKANAKPRRDSERSSGAGSRADRVGFGAGQTPLAERWHTVLLLTVLGAVFGVLVAACGPDRELGFQARLTDANNVPISGTKTITFKLFTVSSGGTAVFTETKSVNVTGGLFNVALGSSVADNQYGVSGIDPETFARPLYLQIEIDGETLTPRQKLLGAPYAMSLVGGALVASSHEGNGAGGSDNTDINYGSLSVVASGGGTALVVGGLTPGDLIRACSGVIAARDCPDLEFQVQIDGDVRADGTYMSPAADFAEMVAAQPGLEQGDVLAIGLDGKLTRSTEAYQQAVVGVYSTRPGFLGNSDYQEKTGYIPLAIVGTVPVKVSMANGSIRPGDMLVASPVPGRAMRAGAHPPQGTVIGKALQGTNRTGVILMLVMLH